MLTYLIGGISGGYLDFMTIFLYILSSLVVIFLILPFHEWAHAFVAYKLGDKGIKYRGRLTLNPIEHIDPIGALAGLSLYLLMTAVLKTRRSAWAFRLWQVPWLT